MIKPLKESEFELIWNWIDKNRKDKIDKEKLLLQLKHLLSVYNYFSYSIKNNIFSLYWKTNDIILDNIRLGKFVVKINLYSPNDYDIWAKALIPNHSKVHKYHYHPHIDSDGMICLGEGEEIIFHSMKEYDFEIIVDSVNRILNNHDDNGAFARIDEWNGKFCKNCLKSCLNLLNCENCKEICCDGCHTICKRCHVWLHHGCVKKDNTCDYCLRVIYNADVQYVDVNELF